MLLLLLQVQAPTHALAYCSKPQCTAVLSDGRSSYKAHGPRAPKHTGPCTPPPPPNPDPTASSISQHIAHLKHSAAAAAAQPASNSGNSGSGKVEGVGDYGEQRQRQEHIYRGPARSALTRLDEFFYYFNRFFLFLGSFFCCGGVFIILGRFSCFWVLLLLWGRIYRFSRILRENT